MNLVDCFYQMFLFSADSYILVGDSNSGEQIFDDPGVDPVSGVGGPYNICVKD